MISKPFFAITAPTPWRGKGDGAMEAGMIVPWPDADVLSDAALWCAGGLAFDVVVFTNSLRGRGAARRDDVLGLTELTLYLILRYLQYLMPISLILEVIPNLVIYGRW